MNQTEKQPDIGDVVTFTHRGVSREGRIVGAVEITNDFRRKRGWWFNIQPIGGDWVAVHESAVGGIVEENIYCR